MTVQTKQVLKGYFNTGDVPTESQFADLIDSLQPRTATLAVAASDATAAETCHADYVCDGTNDEVQIQAAIDALPATGGRVLLSSGTFNITNSQRLEVGPWEPYIGLHIGESHGRVGLAGVEGTVLKLAPDQPANSAMLLIAGLSSERLNRTVIDGIEFDGNIDNQANIWSDYGLIAVSNPSHTYSLAPGVTIRGCHFHDWKHNGSALYTASYCQKIIVTECYFVTNTASCIWSHDAYLVISDNVFLATSNAAGGYMVQLLMGEPGYGQADSLAISGNVFKGGYGHIRAVGGHRANISGNVFAKITNANGSAIRIEEYDDRATVYQESLNHLIVGNIIYNCANGITIESGDRAGCQYNRIAQNMIVEGGDVALNYGIYEHGQNNLCNIIENNTIIGAANPIVADGPGVIVRGNQGYVTENHGAAAAVADGGTIAHGCAAAPASVQVSGSVAGEIVTVTSIDATNITVAIKDGAGDPGTSQTVYWRAWV